MQELDIDDIRLCIKFIDNLSSPTLDFQKLATLHSLMPSLHYIHIQHTLVAISCSTHRHIIHPMATLERTVLNT